jgi:phage replication O-like protein O
MTPQLENGYTSLANEILDEILKLPLSNYEFRIMFAVIRKTYGYHKKDDLIALSQLSKMTFIPISHCSRTVKKLKEKNILSVTQTGKSATLNLAIQKDFSKWILLPKQVRPLPKQVIVLPKQDSSLTCLGNLVLPIQVSTKDTSTKETIQKKIVAQKKSVPSKPKKIVKPKKTTNPLIKQIIEIYFTWHEKQFNSKPVIDGSDAKSVIGLLSYYSINKFEPIAYFKRLLERYNDWDKFYKEQTRLRQIASNAYNITNKLIEAGKKKINKEPVHQNMNAINELNAGRQ